jgi:hypothetical protein
MFAKLASDAGRSPFNSCHLIRGTIRYCAENAIVTALVEGDPANRVPVKESAAGRQESY